MLEGMTSWGAGDEALLVAIAKLDSVGRSHHGAFLVRGGSAEKREAAVSELPKIQLVRSYLQNVNDGMPKMAASMAAARAHRPQKVEGAAEGADPYICRMTRKWGDEFVTSAAFVDEMRTWGTHAKVKSIVEVCPHVRAACMEWTTRRNLSLRNGWPTMSTPPACLMSLRRSTLCWRSIR